MDIKKMIGARIKSIRIKKKLTQEQVSEKMGIHTNYLSSIERGMENPTLNTIINLSNSLGVDIGEIFKSLQVEDKKQRKVLLRSLIKKADDKQLKMATEIMSAIIH